MKINNPSTRFTVCDVSIPSERDLKLATPCETMSDLEGNSATENDSK